MAINYSRNPLTKDPAKEKAFYAARKAISQRVDDAMKDLGGDEMLASLKSANQDYGIASQLERIAVDRTNRNAANKMFGLTDHLTAVGGMSTMGPKGLGLVAAKKGLEKYGNQSLAVGANNISEVLKFMPEKLGKFANVLKAAEQRGPQGVPATHFILQQTNPEYRNILMRMSGDDQGDDQ